MNSPTDTTNTRAAAERVSLSRSKRRGPIKEYLDELDAAAGGGDSGDGGGGGERGLERWFFTDWLRARRRKGARCLQVGVMSASKDVSSRALARSVHVCMWLMMSVPCDTRGHTWRRRPLLLSPLSE
jgi:hypothetical protein